MAEIELRAVSKRWGSFTGVQDFILTIADREFLVLLGPSGCVKTTTMRMMAGCRRPVTAIYVAHDQIEATTLIPGGAVCEMLYRRARAD